MLLTWADGQAKEESLEKDTLLIHKHTHTFPLAFFKKNKNKKTNKEKPRLIVLQQNERELLCPSGSDHVLVKVVTLER